MRELAVVLAVVEDLEPVLGRRLAAGGGGSGGRGAVVELVRRVLRTRRPCDERGDGGCRQRAPGRLRGAGRAARRPARDGEGASSAAQHIGASRTDPADAPRANTMPIERQHDRSANPKLHRGHVVILIRLPGSDPRPEPLLTRLSRSPRALAAGAGALLLIAAAIVVVLVVSGGKCELRRREHPAGEDRQDRAAGRRFRPAEPGDDLHAGRRDLHRPDRESSRRRTPSASTGSRSTSPGTRWRRDADLDAAATFRCRPTPAPTRPPAGRSTTRSSASASSTTSASTWRSLPFVPRWAEGPGEPKPATSPATWNPNPAMFEQFAQAVGTRYSGHYTPKGQNSPLPRVSFWSIWNEPNQGSLGISPQAIDHNTVESSPYHYRLLADAAWTALQKTGHGSDTTLLGEIAPVGNVGAKFPGQFANMVPLRFVRALYCVGSRPPAAARPGGDRCATAPRPPPHPSSSPPRTRCCSTPPRSRRTPTPRRCRPTSRSRTAPDDVVLATLPKLFTTLDRAAGGLRLAQALRRLRHRVRLPDQPAGHPDGLREPGEGRRLAELVAVHLLAAAATALLRPVLVPGPAAGPRQSRTQRFAVRDRHLQGQAQARLVRDPHADLAAGHPPGQGQLRSRCGARSDRPRPTRCPSRAPAEIQFKPSSGGAWKTVKTVSTKTAEGYFDVPVAFPASGSVRIRWTPPSGAAIVSRTTAITVG